MELATIRAADIRPGMALFRQGLGLVALRRPPRPWVVREAHPSVTIPSGERCMRVWVHITAEEYIPHFIYRPKTPVQIVSNFTYDSVRLKRGGKEVARIWLLPGKEPVYLVRHNTGASEHYEVMEPSAFWVNEQLPPKVREYLKTLYPAMLETGPPYEFNLEEDV